MGKDYINSFSYDRSYTIFLKLISLWALVGYLPFLYTGSISKMDMFIKLLSSVWFFLMEFLTFMQCLFYSSFLLCHLTCICHDFIGSIRHVYHSQGHHCSCCLHSCVLIALGMFFSFMFLFSASISQSSKLGCCSSLIWFSLSSSFGFKLPSECSGSHNVSFYIDIGIFDLQNASHHASFSVSFAAVIFMSQSVVPVILSFIKKLLLIKCVRTPVKIMINLIWLWTTKTVSRAESSGFSRRLRHPSSFSANAAILIVGGYYGSCWVLASISIQ